MENFESSPGTRSTLQIRPHRIKQAPEPRYGGVAADLFQDGRIVAECSIDNPIPPVLDKFEALGRPLTGVFTTGNTGAFWAREVGTPVVTNQILIELVSGL